MLIFWIWSADMNPEILDLFTRYECWSFGYVQPIWMLKLEIYSADMNAEMLDLFSRYMNAEILDLFSRYMNADILDLFSRYECWNFIHPIWMRTADERHKKWTDTVNLVTTKEQLTLKSVFVRKSVQGHSAPN